MLEPRRVRRSFILNAVSLASFVPTAALVLSLAAAANYVGFVAIGAVIAATPLRFLVIAGE